MSTLIIIIIAFGCLLASFWLGSIVRGRKMVGIIDEVFNSKTVRKIKNPKHYPVVDVRNGIPPGTLIVDKFKDGLMITDSEDRFISLTWDETYALSTHLKIEWDNHIQK